MHFRLQCLYGEPTVSLRKMFPGKQHKRVVWDIIGSSHSYTETVAFLTSLVVLALWLHCNVLRFSLVVILSALANCPWFMSQTMR